MVVTKGFLGDSLMSIYYSMLAGCGTILSKDANKHTRYGDKLC
jgi:uncharacterized protein YceK